MALLPCLLCMLMHLVSSYHFTDDNWNSFDAYGEKLAANDVVIVQARNADAQFVLQFGPFDTLNVSLPCNVDYVGVTTGDKNFIYNIAVPDTAPDDDASVVFIGENDDVSTSSNPFIGHLRANSSCNTMFHMHSFVQWGHDEFYVLGIDPTGNVAYGFSSQFAFSYDLQTHNINYLLGWPVSSFTPRAVDVNSNSIAVMAGFVSEAQNIYKPLVYLLKLDINSSSIIDTWAYVPVNSSWQTTTSNRDAANFTTKHMMSVAIDDNTSQVLVGMPSMNTVFWFNITLNLYLIANRTNGYQRGYGRSVGWNNEVGGPYPVILGNSYSFPYEWSSSIIYWFGLSSFLSSDPIMPLFPTAQCPRWIDLGQELITVAIMPFNVVIVDSVGQMYAILSTAEGSYPDTSEAIGSNPVFSSTIFCSAGSYKDWVGLDMCYLCSMGKMSELEGSIECSPYDCNGPSSFCPLGSITNDTYSDLIAIVSQNQAYPKSPDSTVFDDILIQNMFTFGQSTHCLVVSPLFWAVVMTGIAGLLLLIMGVLKFFHRWAKVRVALKRIFQQIDLIKEGEMWIGGLASFGLIILLGFAYTFSYAYMPLYPIETSSISTFVCDTSLRNAKFETSVQSLSTSRSNEEQPIFDLLDEQQFTLTIDFVNTQYKCATVYVTQIIHANPKSVAFNCRYNRSMLSVSVVLSSHTLTLNYNFDDVLSIGGLRVSLYGKQQEANNASSQGHYFVRELNFSQPLLVNNKTLAYDPSIVLSLTRVINETTPLSNNEPHLYSALWVPLSINNTQNLFLTLEQFLYYGLLQPSLSISISETTYFIRNVQEPIAKQAEVIFHNLLFTIVCLELFGLIFLAIKLMCLPFFNLVRRFIEKRSNLVHPQPLPISLESTVSNNEEKQQRLLFARRRKKATDRSTVKKGTSWITDEDGHETSLQTDNN